eukprot:CAMPEP_0179472912 /NCGR_PEP_ID=MMETSP0799-20121207/52799_1 /TAXON_ID=46947 /ORGANISM="Geminigera cryophila, Strain CCMP2564" /LENGTH=471 /DNA_ID=CAMNT_0021281311 /DNA_START=159 /DNA_END=1575 /DNA_ORIENTATION=+
MESPCEPDATLSKQLVHVSCDLSGMKPLGSAIVGVQDLRESDRVGLRLESKCEVREWHESSRTETDNRGKKTTQYSYARDWSTKYIESSSFHDPTACRAVNNGQQCVNTNPEDQTWWTNDMNVKTESGSDGYYIVERAPSIFVGGFSVPADMRAKLGNSQRDDLHPSLDCTQGPAHCPVGVSAEGTYTSYRDSKGPATSSTPMRRQFRIANATHATVIAQQIGKSFVPWVSPYDKRYSLYYVMDGLVSADAMLAAAEGENAAVTWMLRMVSFVCCFLGITLMLSPIETPCYQLLATGMWSIMDCLPPRAWHPARKCSGSGLVFGGDVAATKPTAASEALHAVDRAVECEASAPFLPPQEEGRGSGRAPAQNPDSHTRQPSSDTHKEQQWSETHKQQEWGQTHKASRQHRSSSRQDKGVVEEERECVVCLVEARSHLLRPCGHVCVCEMCSQSVEECPLCRAPITEAIRAFL